MVTVYNIVDLKAEVNEWPLKLYVRFEMCPFEIQKATSVPVFAHVFLNTAATDTSVPTVIPCLSQPDTPGSESRTLMEDPMMLVCEYW